MVPAVEYRHVSTGTLALKYKHQVFPPVEEAKPSWRIGSARFGPPVIRKY